MKRLRSYWLPTVLVILWAINMIIWAPQIGYLNYNHNDLHIVVLQVLHGVTILAFLLVILMLGDYLSQLTSNIATAAKLWCYTIGLTSGIVFFSWLVFNHFNIQELYNALFPITRNTVPFATAIIVGSCILPWLSRKMAPNASWWVIALFFPFASTTIFSRDLFGILNVHTVTFFLLVMALGALSRHITIDHHTLSKWTVSWSLAAFVLTAIMPNISFKVHGSMLTAARFTTPASLTIIAVAFNLYLLIRPVIKQSNSHYRSYFWLSLAILLTNQSLISQLAHYINHFNSWAMQILLIILLTLVLVAIAFIMPIVADWLQARFAISKRLNLVLSPGSFDRQSADIVVRRLARAVLNRWPNILALVVSYILADLSIYYMGNNTLFVKQSMLWLTTLFFFLIFKALQAIFNHYWVALITMGIFVVIWTVANIQKMQLRN